MASASPFHMPGAFHFSETTTSTTALNANMFRPPLSPSDSTYNLSKSSGSMLSDNTSANNNITPAPKLGRKRTYDETKVSSSYFDKVSAMEDSARGQHRYTLAGQIETPGTQLTPGSGALDDSLYSDIDYRRRLELGSKRPHDDPSTPSLDLSGLASSSTAPVTPRAAGWTTFAFQAIGGVVGKVWEFCKGGAGAFQGFKAGGGKAYGTNGQPVNTANNQTPLRVSTDIPRYPEKQETPLSPPGAFPLASDVISYLPDSIPDYQDHRQEEICRGYQEQEEHEQQQVHQHQQEQEQRDQERRELERQEFQRCASPDSTTDRPAPKRRQTGTIGESDELRRNWVMVDENEDRSPLARRLNTKRSSLSSVSSSRIPARSSNMASRLQQPKPYSTPTKAPGPMNPPARRFSVTSPRFGFEQKSGIQPPRSASRLSMASNASYAGGSITSPTLGPGEASFASPRSPPSRSTPATPTFAINGSRIPQPKGLGLGGPNPFANIRTQPPSNNQRISPSRPTSRHSAHHSVHSLQSPLSSSLIPRSNTPSHLGHRRSATSLSAGRGNHPGGQVDPQLSPRLDDEAKRLAAQRAAAEKRNTSRLDKLNGELQALIRQGQAALDTEFDVEMGDGNDDGWDDYIN